MQAPYRVRVPRVRFVLAVCISVEGIQSGVLRDNEDDIVVCLAIRPTSRKLAGSRSTQIKRLPEDLTVHLLGKERNEVALDANERRVESRLICVHAGVFGVDLPSSNVGTLCKCCRCAE